MEILFSFAMSLLGTVILMPRMMRYASVLGLMDDPGDERKVHTTVIPRCGGIAIALASILPMYFWLPINTEILGVVSGGVIIFVFGFLDDVLELNYKWKFLGQISAVLTLIYFGVVINEVPFLSPSFIYYRECGYLLTFFFLLGCINAVNLSDGLDGLAAGVSLLSLGLIVVYSTIVGSSGVTIIAIITIGGLLGFLRFNTYPAQVFLGDTGSQLAGYILSALLIIVTQIEDGGLSLFLPVLVLGLPIFDTLMVMTIRVRNGRSPFSPDRNHFHHQLMKLGLPHYRAVAVIYLMQFFLLCAAYFLRHESDLTLLLFYASFCFMLAIMLYIISNSELIVGGHGEMGITQDENKRNNFLRRFKWFYRNSTNLIQVSVCVLYLLLLIIVGGDIPDFLSLSFIVISPAVCFTYFFFLRNNIAALRVILYSGAVVIAYLWGGVEVGSFSAMFMNVYLLLLLLLLVAAIRMTRKEYFQLDNQDLLVFIAVLVVPQISLSEVNKYALDHFTFRLVVLFYVSEFLVSRTDYNKNLICAVIPVGIFSTAIFSYLF